MEKTLSLKIDRVQTTLDSITKDIEELKEDKDIGVHQKRDLRIKVDKHETQLNKLEQAN